MIEQSHQIPENEFLQHYLQNAQHLMWFLGAGTSRSAGMPTATDIIWDLKRRYYCLHENQDLQTHDISNNAIKQRIQSYFDSKGYPAIWSPEEYSVYFELTFSDDLAAQQKYINEALATDKICLNIGQRALAAMLEMGQARIIFTTNFDDVIETAYATVSGKNLSAFHLEGSYAALEALNAERFPLYAKLHGDFRYQSIKNLSGDLVDNDKEIQKCFLAAATRYGLVVSGYSGRDENVMSMFREAIDQNNAFPHGVFWTVPKLSSAVKRVTDMIEYAQQKGVRSYLVETGTFDEMLSRIWRQVLGKPQSLDEKVRTARVERVSIPLPSPGKQYPILRTNALPVVTSPASCGSMELAESMTFYDLKRKKDEKRPRAILTYTDRVLFWGDEMEVLKVLPEGKTGTVRPFVFDDAVQEVSGSSFVQAFFEEAIAKALCWEKPLLVRKRDRTYYAVVRDDAARDNCFADLRNALGSSNQPATIAGRVPGLQDVTWAEAVSVQLEERGGRLWVMLRPDIWIKPLARRQEAIAFLRQMLIRRYNSKSYHLLNAWIGILLGAVGSGDTVKISSYPEFDFSAIFEIGTRTAYSHGGGHA